MITNTFTGIRKKEDTGFSAAYHLLRIKEQRVYSDDIVSKLPETEQAHIHFSEWKVRKQNSRKLLQYLKAKKHNPLILDIGCGNGWLSHKLSSLPGSAVTGIDLTEPDIEQARRVFDNKNNLQFQTASPFAEWLNDCRFDVIVLAASVQYFTPFENIMNRCLQLLNTDGEIHITDTHFYKRNQLAAAQHRSHEYFSGLGFAVMSDFYHHHCIEDLEKFNFYFRYRPGLFKRFFLGQASPFPWIIVAK